MTGSDVEVRGATRLRATLARAADELGHLDRAGEASARLVQTRAASAAPKVSGTLARSLTARASGPEAVVSSSLIYAPVIHNGWPGHSIRANPFLDAALDDSVELIVPLYLHDVRDVLSNVKGV